MTAIEKMANLAKKLPELRQSRASGHLSINGLLPLAPSLWVSFPLPANIVRKISVSKLTGAITGKAKLRITGTLRPTPLPFILPFDRKGCTSFVNLLLTNASPFTHLYSLEHYITFNCYKSIVFLI